MNDEPQFFNNALNKTDEITKQVTDNAKKAIGYYTSKTTVVLGLIFVILLCFFVAFGLYVLISQSIFNQSKLVIPGTKVPIVCNSYTKYSIENFNKSGNGKRRSYTFWIYINDLNKFNGSYKHVFHIGDTPGDITKASPYVFLDKFENKLYVRFASTGTDTYTAMGIYPNPTKNVQNFNTNDQKNSFVEQGIEVPYVPIQRWVHIAIVVNENTNGGTIAAYVDGDLSKIVTTNDILEGGGSVKVRDLDLDRMGDLHVGGSISSDSIGVGFSGLISKVTMFNYDLNDRDIIANYNEGPLDGFLSSLGLANYGLRSPIYKIV
jgi:hypothetical protein